MGWLAHRSNLLHRRHRQYSPRQSTKRHDLDSFEASQTRKETRCHVRPSPFAPSSPISSPQLSFGRPSLLERPHPQVNGIPSSNRVPCKHLSCPARSLPLSCPSSVLRPDKSSCFGDCGSATSSFFIAHHRLTTKSRSPKHNYTLQSSLSTTVVLSISHTNLLLHIFLSSVTTFLSSQFPQDGWHFSPGRSFCGRCSPTKPCRLRCASDQ